jgi:hypothetical protein
MRFLKQCALALGLLFACVSPSESALYTYLPLPLSQVQGGVGTAVINATAGDLFYASANGTMNVLHIGSNAQCLTVASSMPSWASCGGGGGPTLAGTQTWTGTNTFQVNFVPIVLSCPGSNTCDINTQSQILSEYYGPQQSASCSSGIGPNGTIWQIHSNSNSVGLPNVVSLAIGASWNGSLEIASCVPFDNTAGIYSDATASSNGVVAAYPWHPATDPRCTVSTGGTSCSTTFTAPHTGMKCSGSPQGTGLLGGVGQFAPGFTASSDPTWTITATFAAPVTGGGTDTFSTVCV